MGVTADRRARALRFRQPAGVDLEGRPQVRLTDKIEIDGVEGRRRFRRRGGLRNGAGRTLATRGLRRLVLDSIEDEEPMSPTAVSYMQLALYDLLGALFAPSDPWPVSRRAH